jgi:hypothetical protein
MVARALERSAGTKTETVQLLGINRQHPTQNSKSSILNE